MKHTEYIVPIGNEAEDYDEIFIGVLRKHKELIRCKECFWYITNELKQDGTVDKRYKPSFCELRRKYMPTDGYCSEAERREDANI